jgi:Rrf2 family transcriptional regulator, iron-sulfur cluster assembly transcription factor
MSLLSRKSLLAIAAIIDVALHARGRPVSAKQLAARQGLPPRHLEPVLQALVRDGILKGIRGPRGGYELARERRRINVDEIIRAARSAEDREEGDLPRSGVLADVVLDAVAEAERAFSGALAQINVEDLTRRAQTIREGSERNEIDFTI